MTASTLTLLTRVGCSLCEKAEKLLLERGLKFERRDIGGDVALEQTYGWDIPVLLEGDKPRLKGIFSAARLEKLGL